MRILTLAGTRPEIIRLSRILNKFDANSDHALCFSGQNFDTSLSAVFFEQLSLRPPAFLLDASGPTLGTFASKLFVAFEEVLAAYKPDALVVLGDTNTALGAILAERRGIPVYHLEAGNRSFDRRVPEEANRRMLDHLCSFNLAYTEHARRNLLAEGLHPRSVGVVGSPLREVYHAYEHLVDNEAVLESIGCRVGSFILLSLHREENVENCESLFGILNGVEQLRRQWSASVVVTVHPRLRQRLVGWSVPEGWLLSEPFGYLEYLALQRSASLVISDSGSLGEEAAILGFPAVTPRASMERPEALETGTVILGGVRAADIVERGTYAVEAFGDGCIPACPESYMIADTSERVFRFVLSTVPVAGFWSGRSGVNG